MRARSILLLHILNAYLIGLYRCNAYTVCDENGFERNHQDKPRHT